MSQLEKDAARWRKLLEYCDIQHVDDRDMEPVFEIQIPCDWRVKNFTEAVDLIDNYESEEEN